MSSPLRVAIIGTGPSGFYAAEHLLKQRPGIEIDLIDRLPTPFGLVRGGVAPDHQKIKSVTRIYERIATGEGVRFLGHVEVGRDLSRPELQAHYHAIIYAVGAHADRSLGVPGEALAGSHAATEFVGWYNGHPDFRDRRFDLSQESVAVIGMGNVAIDVVRILARTPDELMKTDIAEHALEALRQSRVRTVTMIGRRGPAQAAFTNPELKELGEMAGADIDVRPEELVLDAATEAQLAATEDKSAERNLHTLHHFAGMPLVGKPKRIALRFLRSPMALEGETRVERVVLGKNRLVAGRGGDPRAEATGESETLPAGLVFRSVGYFGAPLADLPFDARRGIFPNVGGRLTTEAGTTLPGEYVVGWIKRGPSGVIGTNKPDAVESADALLEDAAAGRLLAPAAPSAQAVDRRLAARGTAVVAWSDWHRLDQMEKDRGAAAGRPRVKFTRVEEMLAALDR